jgi:hypothetical protein
VSDPRFDARFQRGYVAPEGEAAASAPEPAPVQPPAPVVRADPVPVPVPVLPGPDPEPVVVQHEPVEPEPRGGRNPFRIALGIVGVVLLIAAGALIQQSVATQSTVDEVRNAFLQVAQPLIPTLGFSGFLAVILAISLGGVRR